MRAARIERISFEPSLYLPAATLPLAPLKWMCVTSGSAISRAARAKPTNSLVTSPCP